MKELKKYIIWFIIWLLSVVTFTYAATNGGIGNLFERNGDWNWVLKWENIQNWSIDSTKIKNWTIKKEDLITSMQTSLGRADSSLQSFSENDPKALKIYWDTIKTSWFLKIWNNSSSSSRQTNMIKIWNWNNIKIGEWEEDDMLSIYARRWVKINWKMLNLSSWAWISSCYSSNVWKYSLSSDWILKKCIKIPADTKTIDSWEESWRTYYDSAKRDCANYWLFWVSCPSWYYTTGWYCWTW
jgi:hypothetical protein